jgi:iron complex outermembrane receptor protein/outer membrane receptor for ferrienterochelin and colicins
MRAGVGMGYKIPNPFAQQDIEYNPLTISYYPQNLKPEMSYGYNLEGNYKKEWDKYHTLFINHAFFLTQVKDPLTLVPISNNLTQLLNVGSELSTMGFDTYIKVVLKKWELYGGYTYTNATSKYMPNGKVPLTPANRMAFVIVKEIAEEWRFGLEGSFTGSQYRYDGSSTPSYMFMALMAQHNFSKHLSVVLNCENLLDYKMSKVESVYTGTITNPAFKPLWAPIDGRVINLSVRWKL